ncbi:restriction endonuclease subunit S [Chloracidobacterium aggregatum]|uniref:restriction endonuclease subunit S n=1 Tax=Chloracidobacterium aggregatum TaxID=2851959 RepID=UPI001B8D003A|nr:restriction endonuclease subunit S [Chloracidobacterium aggregatum]QUV92473.1 restriction endonuclease subunit S [Chloracidobacterium sp. A]
MAGEWIEVPFPEVIDFQEGPGILAKDFRNDGVPLVRLSGLERGGSVLSGCNYLDPEMVARKWTHFALATGDVLLSTSASLGRIAVVGEDAVGAIPYTGIIRMRPRDGRLIAPFLRYLLEGPDFQQQAEMVGVGSVIRHFGPMHLRQMSVKLPPPDDQRAIAHILGTLDDKIELNRRMSQTLEAMARALFKAWFVDFDPVRAKMEGRWQRGQSLPGLPAHLYDLFPDRLVDSELGEIPEGWEVATLGNVAENPRRSVQPYSIPPDTPYIALEHMPRRCIALSDWGTAEGIESNKFEFRKGEILFGKLRPYFHKVGVAPVDGVCSTDIVVVCPRTPHWFAFVLCVVSSDDFVEFTNAGSTGTKMPRTSWADMARYEIALPPDALAQAFNGIVRRQVDRLIAAVHESRTLAALRDALLPKLIRGEIRVKDAERFLKEREL